MKSIAVLFSWNQLQIKHQCGNYRNLLSHPTSTKISWKQLSKGIITKVDLTKYFWPRKRFARGRGHSIVMINNQFTRHRLKETQRDSKKIKGNQRNVQRFNRLKDTHKDTQRLIEILIPILGSRQLDQRLSEQYIFDWLKSQSILLQLFYWCRIYFCNWNLQGMPQKQQPISTT